MMEKRKTFWGEAKHFKSTFLFVSLLSVCSFLFCGLLCLSQVKALANDSYPLDVSCSEPAGSGWGWTQETGKPPVLTIQTSTPVTITNASGVVEADVLIKINNPTDGNPVHLILNGVNIVTSDTTSNDDSITIKADVTYLELQAGTTNSIASKDVNASSIVVGDASAANWKLYCTTVGNTDNVGSLNLYNPINCENVNHDSSSEFLLSLSHINLCCDCSQLVQDSSSSGVVALSSLAVGSYTYLIDLDTTNLQLKAGIFTDSSSSVISGYGIGPTRDDYPTANAEISFSAVDSTVSIETQGQYQGQNIKKGGCGIYADSLTGEIENSEFSITCKAPAINNLSINDFCAITEKTSSPREDQLLSIKNSQINMQGANGIVMFQSALDVSNSEFNFKAYPAQSSAGNIGLMSQNNLKLENTNCNFEGWFQSASSLNIAGSSIECACTIPDPSGAPFMWAGTGGATASITGESVITTISADETQAGIIGIPSTAITNTLLFHGYYKDSQDYSVIWSDTQLIADTFHAHAPITIPTDLTVEKNQSFGPATEDIAITVASGTTLTNYGTLYYPQSFTCEEATSTNLAAGKINTEASYDVAGGQPQPASELLCAQEGKAKKTYTNLPSVTKDGVQATWYQDSAKTKVADNTAAVDPNAHTLYASYTTPDPEPGPDPTPDDNVTITFRTDEGSWNGTTETTLAGAPDAVIIPPSYPYTDATRTCIGWFDETGKEIVSGVTTFAEVTGVVTAHFVDTPGWHQNATGWWYVYDLNNNYYTNCWALINSAWFYFNDAGYCLEYTWSYINGEWYFFGWGGYMQTGWQWISGSWYFLDRNSGAMQAGWVHDGVWYYCDAALGGAMYDNCWAYIGGAWYGFNEGGSMTQGWSYSYSYDGWFYLQPDTGHMLYGWQYIGGHWYYFYDNGLMAANTYVGNYWLGADGAWS